MENFLNERFHQATNFDVIFKSHTKWFYSLIFALRWASQVRQIDTSTGWLRSEWILPLHLNIMNSACSATLERT